VVVVGMLWCQICWRSSVGRSEKREKVFEGIFVVIVPSLLEGVMVCVRRPFSTSIV
jgi:hypothetical protein